MNETTQEAALAEFDREIALARTPQAAFCALQVLTEAIVGAKLFTVMGVDMAAGVARRMFTSDPEAYPVTGTKPIERNSWFEVVHGERRPFVANTLEDIAKVFPREAFATRPDGRYYRLRRGEVQKRLTTPARTPPFDYY